MAAQTLPFWLETPAAIPAVRAAELAPPAMSQPFALDEVLATLRPRLSAELLTHVEARAHVAAWRDLSRRALEQNVFFEPEFVLAAAQHFAMARKPRFILVWEETHGHRRLIGLCPVLLPRRGWTGIAWIWRHAQSSSGTPLLDAGMASEALAQVLACLRAAAPHAEALLAPRLAADGPTAALLRAHAASAGRPARSF